MLDQGLARKRAGERASAQVQEQAWVRALEQAREQARARALEQGPEQARAQARARALEQGLKIGEAQRWRGLRLWGQVGGSPERRLRSWLRWPAGCREQEQA